MTDKDRREYVRLSISRSVNFLVKGRPYQGLIENTSDSGAFIKTDGRFSEGQDISMTIESPKFGSEKKTGKIVRVTPEGIGVEFSHPGYTR
jgi:Tfp pilus assembly protein PilZ